MCIISDIIFVYYNNSSYPESPHFANQNHESKVVLQPIICNHRMNECLTGYAFGVKKVWFLISSPTLLLFIHELCDSSNPNHLTYFLSPFLCSTSSTRYMSGVSSAMQSILVKRSSDGFSAIIIE